MLKSNHFHVFLFLLLVIPINGCSTFRNVNLYSDDEEVQIGQAFNQEIGKQYPVMDDSRINSFLQERGDKLVAVSERKDIKYHFAGVNDDVVNAFAIPGGYCYIHLGLIRQTKTESELISVVAHEISHVTNRHGVKRMSQMQLADVASQVLLGNRGEITNMVANLFTTSGMLYYSREAEREADYDGLLIMYKAGYNPQGMVSMFEMLQSKQQGGEPSGWQNLFSTHPITSERIDNARQLISTLPPKTGLINNSTQWDGLKKYIADKYPPKKKEN